MIEVNRWEVYRYLGYGAENADEETKRTVEECIAELGVIAKPRYEMREYPLILGEHGAVDGTCFQTVSYDLSKNLAGCGRILVMAATLGTETDRRLFRYEKLSISRAVVLQAAAAAMLEAYCDSLCGEWKREFEAEGYFLRPRFSPGYGDFSLSCQAGLLEALEAGKRIGITLTDRMLMAPSKSVTAVIGVGREPLGCVVSGCMACGKTDCEYRRQ